MRQNLPLLAHAIKRQQRHYLILRGQKKYYGDIIQKSKGKIQWGEKIRGGGRQKKN